MIDPQKTCLDCLDNKVQLAAEFKRIWDVYPKRVKESESLASYRARRKEGIRFRTLYAAVLAYKAERKGEDPKYTMHADAFFGPNNRWKDYDGKGSNGKTTMDPKRSAAQRRMQQEEDEAWEKRQKTEETQTTDPSQTMKSVTERLKDL